MRSEFSRSTAAANPPPSATATGKSQMSSAARKAEIIIAMGDQTIGKLHSRELPKPPSEWKLNLARPGGHNNGLDMDHPMMSSEPSECDDIDSR
jgi:hypothetical protein